MAKNSITKSDTILIHLIDNRVVRRGERMWKWSEGKGPSLADTQVLKLFCAALVEEVDKELKLTTWGKIIAEEKKQKVAN